MKPLYVEERGDTMRNNDLPLIFASHKNLILLNIYFRLIFNLFHFPKTILNIFVLASRGYNFWLKVGFGIFNQISITIL